MYVYLHIHYLVGTYMFYVIVHTQNVKSNTEGQTEYFLDSDLF